MKKATEVAPTIEAECQALLPKDLSGGAFFQDGRSRCFEVADARGRAACGRAELRALKEAAH